MISKPFHPGSYRTDIDGLRAIAVISVVLFHIDKSLIPGGFIGVDIFFVISGFLITRSIVDELEQGRFSIIAFYVRRIKRIIPAMFAVILATTLLAQFVLIPEDAERTAQSALWASFSLGNVYFWLFQDTGYFANSSSQLPLLHLWSLGVEEQFYLLWPFVLLFIYPMVRGRHLLSCAALAALLSFALGEWLFSFAPSFTYYMLPTRAGELIIGAIAAIIIVKKPGQHLPSLGAQLVAAIGLLLIAGSMILLNEAQTFPGLRAIPPTVGAALIILAGHRRSTYISEALSQRALVWVGLISYSVYLWHWPILAFYRYGHGVVDPAAGVVIFVLTLAVGWLSYLYIERPIRQTNLPSKVVISRFYVTPTFALVILALGAQYLDGYGVHFFSTDYRDAISAQRIQRGPGSKSSYCLNWRVTSQDADSARCIIGDRRMGDPKVLLWGDSNADHYIGMLSVFADRDGYNFRTLNHSACPSIFDDPKPFLDRKLSQHWNNCEDSLILIKEKIESYPVIFISSSWSGYQGRNSEFLNSVYRTVDSLSGRGHRVVILGKAPEFQLFDYQCREKALRLPFVDCSTIERDELQSEFVDSVNHQLRAYAEMTENVEYFDPTPYLCPHGKCSVLDPEGEPFYRNRSHISEKGSLRLGKLIVDEEGIPAVFSRVSGWVQAASRH